MSYVVTVGTDRVSEHINQGLDVALEGMEKDGLITEEQRKEMIRYRIVVHEPGFWGTIWKKIFPGKDSDWKLTAVRMCQDPNDIMKEN